MDIDIKVLKAAAENSDVPVTKCYCGGKIAPNEYLGYCEDCGLEFSKESSTPRARAYTPIFNPFQKDLLKENGIVVI